MALLGSESWDIYSTADIADYWQQTGTGTIVAGQGRCSTAAYHYNSAVGNGPVIGVNTSVDGGYCGWARSDSLSQTVVILQVQSAGGITQIMLVSQPNGSLEWWRGPNLSLGTFLVGTAPGLITADHYYHIGAEWLCLAAGGYVKVWVNDVIQASISGVSTRCNPAFAAQGPWRALNFQGRTGYMDDLYWGDSSGAAPDNAFLGDLRVEGQLALTDVAGGGGTFHDFTPSTGTDHGALVDEVPPDDDTTYLQSGVVGQQETFKFPAISLASGTVYGIQLMPNVKKSLSGARTIANIVYRGGTLAEGLPKGLSQTNYNYQPQMFNIDPTTSTAWTATTANAMEGGIEVVT